MLVYASSGMMVMVRMMVVFLSRFVHSHPNHLTSVVILLIQIGLRHVRSSRNKIRKQGEQNRESRCTHVDQFPQIKIRNVMNVWIYILMVVETDYCKTKKEWT